MKTMWNNIRWFFRKVKRVWNFLPHVWRGYDFDYRYSVDLFIYQLERQAKFFESDRAYSSERLNQASRIRTAIKLLEKVYDDDYGCEYQDQLRQAYGDNVLDWWFEDTGKGDDSSYLRYEYEKWDNADEVRTLKDNLFKLSQKKQKRAEELVWKFIAHNIRYWWD